MKWNMKVGTVRVHGTDEVLIQLLEALTTEGKEAKKINSYVEFVLSKEEYADEEGFEQFSKDVSTYVGVIAVEIYHGVKYNQVYNDTTYDISDDNFHVAMKYLRENSMEKEYFEFVHSPEYKKAQQLKKITAYEKKLNTYKERLMAV
jgi:LysM repeat protein